MTDKDAWDNWETAADAGLADYVAPKPNKPSKQPSPEALWKDANQHAPSPTIIHTDTARTQYQPEIKILKRPTGSTAPMHARGTNSGSPKTKKTLAEREKEYQEARERIFGSSK
ncbi:SUZ domain-containing protein [Gongronella butleri]|nr:SUZ domain-containing protein [Gongronella butleri]